MKFNISRFALGLTASLLAMQVWAAPVVVAERGPDLSVLDGVQSDPFGAGLETTTFADGGNAGYRITRIEWWGSVSPSTVNPSSFDLVLNGTQLLTEANVFGVIENDFRGVGDLYRYSIDVSQSVTLQANNVLTLGTTDPDSVFWFWQFASGVQEVSFRISGEATTQVPEPSSALLVALAGLGLVATRRSKA